VSAVQVVGLLTGLVLALAGTVIFVFLRERRRLDELGRRHRMQRPVGQSHREVLRGLPPSWGNRRVRHILVGRDTRGRYLQGRVGLWGDRREIFLLELSRHTPARGLALEARDDQQIEELQLRWNLSPEQAVDNQAREIVQRVLREFAAFKIQKPGLRISLEVADHGAVLHAPVEGEKARNEFLAAARVLRRDLLHCLYKRGPVAMEVGEEEAVPTVHRPLMAEEPRREEPLAPAETDPRAWAGEVDPGPSEAELESMAVDPDPEAPTVAVPHLNALDRSNGADDPPRKGWRRVNGRDVFEIPEPDERVIVLQACASRTKAEKKKKDETDEELKRRIWF
jgi:uncharacterized small protein (DUF1192 family)